MGDLSAKGPGDLGVLLSHGVDVREALELAYVFHIVPACDGRMTDVYLSTLDKYNDSNLVCEKEHSRFVKYSQALMVVHAVQRYKSLAKIECDEGYNLKSQKWYKECLAMRPTMPPECDWGKARLCGQFVFEKRMEQEAYDCGDVTHIVNDRERYLGPEEGSKEDRWDSNELLYFLRHAPYLSYSHDPTQARRDINEGRGIKDNIALIANKSENTKPGDAQRETLSANDILRAYLSETDAQSIQVAAMFSGASMRASEPATAERIQEIKQATKGNTVIVSLDVKGWSPNMDREHAFRVFDVIMHAVEKVEGYSPDFRPAYKDLELLLSRRGTYKSQYIPTGMIEGWTGTCDTIMHTLMTSYCIRQAKDLGLVPRGATGTSMAMIDDAVIVVNLPSDVADEERQRLAQVFMDLVRSTYRSLGFIVEASKTICSSRVATYLNRVYACGSEVIVPAKTFAKIAAEHRLRFSGHLNRSSAIWAGARGACGRGADPVVTYVQASYLFLLEVFAGDRVQLPG